MNASNRNISFVPHEGPQEAFVNCPIFETVYGGARGGGKTFACLGEFMIHSQNYGELAKGIFLRRTREALKDAIREAKIVYAGVAKWRSTINEFHFKNGAILVFNYLDRDEDADNYQGHQYTRVYIEELSQFPSPDPVFKMFATLRSARGVPCQFRASCNPGGPGHNWVKSRYVDSGPYKVVYDEETNSKRVYIPAKIADNPTLLKNDPEYVNRLKMVGGEQLVKAWLDGDWSIIEGAFFTEWNENVHVLDHRKVMSYITEDWKYFIAGDWGSAKPFSFGWYVIVPDKFWYEDRLIPRGALIRIKEWYGTKKGQFNKGLKLASGEVGKGVVKRTEELSLGKPLYRVLDPSAFKQDGGPSVEENMRLQGAAFRPADNKRVARKGAMGGWDMMRNRLSGEDGVPMLYVTERSPHFIRTVPTIQHDKNNMEDVDTEAEDHVADEVRYAVMSRPWQPKKKIPGRVVPKAATAKEFWRGVTFDKKEPERIRL